MALMDTDFSFPQTGEVVEVDNKEAEYVLDLVSHSGIEPHINGTVKRIIGGISSDVWLLDCPQENSSNRYVIKQPLATLRVRKNWSAPLKRAKYEYLWLNMAAQVSPQCVPKVCYFDESKPLLITHYIDISDASVWQRQLFSACFDLSFVKKLGHEIARFHQYTAFNEFYEKQFDSSGILRATRIEPYIFSLIDIYPEMTERLTEIGESVISNRIAVIHGDLSPKNILCRNATPIFLDAECACYADPAFDIAFCLNHLLIKFYRLGDIKFILLARVLTETYLREVNWENRNKLERRIATLIPVMMLARIDGKSTLTYLNDHHKKLIRKQALTLLSKNLFTIDFVLNEISSSM
ncbi:phosphotransferase family protein [Brenneria uluponensis]|uniref:phosphotransferase family protein n=1 Tax=Brenneria uluponensis TaxID=3057057 RepID=UPI0028E514E5|nr:phosphotransferase [Brenneria ulupoensis]